ncbi:hypothetical protein CBR_g31099 [Chara braunii]|uniref:Uncharacterized protein n=1 Tax=Chara braunii TaxID=69332 RepID=A0A388LEA7_CHABU|nr:hypothetical protein CBR_g31099 [Chara braunii]|eukprot:GBG80639.1 hypothetical protein CBR_g31099 [Chara braunii]
MAEHLASIFGTEKDRVNCPFYFKIGACRHGDRCSRLHNRPNASQTLLFANMYQSPDANIQTGMDQQGNVQQVDPKAVQEHFEDFYEDIFEELAKYGELECLHVCDNLADHMIGNVYVKFNEEEQAAAALRGLQGRFYAGRPIIVDFSPVTDFREATCRQYEENNCNRGGYCNFMHLKRVGRDMRRRLFGRFKRPRSRSRSRSGSPYARGGQDRGSSPRRRYYDKPYPDERRGYRERGGGGGGRGRGRGRFFNHNNRFGDDRRWRRREHSRSCSPDTRQRGGRERSAGREGSVERRAKIEQWNREREQQTNAPASFDNSQNRNSVRPT